MPLSSDRKKQFRTLGHNLKPVVTVAGNGLSQGVVDELNRALNDHELIKVKLVVADRDSRKQVVAEMCEVTSSELVQEIGKVALIYRQAAKPKLGISNIPN